MKVTKGEVGVFIGEWYFYLGNNKPEPVRVHFTQGSFWADDSAAEVPVNRWFHRCRPFDPKYFPDTSCMIVHGECDFCHKRLPEEIKMLGDLQKVKR